MGLFFERQKTGSTPFILIDEEKGYIRFEGESFHENVAGFFREVNDWLTLYIETGKGDLVFDCMLKYFNSSTAKLLLNILLDMDSYAAAGNKVTVNWYAEKDNEIIIECGEDFRDEMFNLEFNLIIAE